ncbi:MAG: pantoate--beta-alanine ligase [Desulfobacterales bacterium]|nr:pantoate--beta-alanine ligase [Desulfobacterales bacterium]
MEIIDVVDTMKFRADQVRNMNQKIAFVPTMGFLHEGHLALLDKGKHIADHLVLSIFVNPTQFSQTEDYTIYPKNLEKDLSLAEQYGVDTVFTPDKETMYPSNYQSYVYLEHLPNFLCGRSRPTHFKGVTTIVTKLFNIVKPHYAIFGEKDYQQLAIIRHMVRDLNMDIQVIGLPIVREADGLAMSSRNSYLNPEQRKIACCLYQCITLAKKMVASGEKNASTIIETASNHIRSYIETRIDYLNISNTETLEDIKIIDQPALFALAVYVGKTRLIDNTILNPL